MMRIVELGLVP